MYLIIMDLLYLYNYGYWLFVSILDLVYDGGIGQGINFMRLIDRIHRRIGSEQHLLFIFSLIFVHRIVFSFVLLSFCQFLI